jgi:hypothetical protein
VSLKAACAVTLAAAGLASAGATAIARATPSLYSGPGPRPGPTLLYEKPAIAPQLTNRKPWNAPPILVSGTTAYRDGEFLYQDYLYDDHGAHDTADPTNPQSQQLGDLFSMPNGTYTYPTGPGYAGNAADLVEFRVKPRKHQTAFRVTLNTLENPQLIAFSIAIGGTPGQSHPFPDGANVSAPASMFLTVHPQNGLLVADLQRATAAVRVEHPRVRVDLARRQIEVDIPHRLWNPHHSKVRLAMGVGLWDRAAHRYLLPGLTASKTRPGGAGVSPHPAAFFNVAFRTHEPVPSVTESTNAVLNAAWWRDRAQGHALASGDISPFFAQVDFGKLARKTTDDSQVPRSGPMDRILASHFEPSQGVDFTKQCGFGGASNPGSCVPEYRGRLEPYAVYVPAQAPRTGYGMTLQLHSLSANYNQYLGSRNESQFANRAVPSIVITPEARGPDQEYEGLGEADVFEVWADIARRYRLNPAYTEITGYSMGGIGTFKIGEQFPDLFARAQPTVGTETTTGVIASLRNVPVLMWNNSADELVNPVLYTLAANALASDNYRYELDVFAPCVNVKCSPVFSNHLELAINDQYAPAAAFLDTATVNRNPAHVTYVIDTARDSPGLGIKADHAYWAGGIATRDTSKLGTFDAFSHGFGTGDPQASTLHTGVGTLAGGNMGPLAFLRFFKTWGATPKIKRADAIDVHATNIRAATIDAKRAGVDCGVTVHVTSDGPIAISLAPPCHRTVRAG